MACGSRRIRHQSIGEGLWPGGGEGIAWVCDACHHIGPPFLADAPDQPQAEDRLWDAEYQDVASEIDDDAWRTTPPREGQTARRPLGILLIGVGLMFLVPALSSIAPAVLTGDPFFVLGQTVRVALLLGIGIALVAVGWPFLRRPKGRLKDPSPEATVLEQDEAARPRP